MRRARGLILGLALLPAITASPAGAAQEAAPKQTAAQKTIEAQYTPALRRCLENKDNFSTLGMTECVYAEVKVQDARLNVAYAKALTDLTPAQKAKLVAAQRAWIAFRDADCAAQQDADFGSISKIYEAYCNLDRTIVRTQDLKDYPDGWEK